MVWYPPLSATENSWIRFLLGRELHRMKRPDISDRLEGAMFRLQGRELWIAVPGASGERFAAVLTEAGLNCGLAVDSAQIC
jgi:hypothetical protein